MKLEPSFFLSDDLVFIFHLLFGRGVVGSSSSSPPELPISFVDSSSYSDFGNGSFFFFLPLFLYEESLELVILVSKSSPSSSPLLLVLLPELLWALLLETPLVELPRWHLNLGDFRNYPLDFALLDAGLQFLPLLLRCFLWRWGCCCLNKRSARSFS